VSGDQRPERHEDQAPYARRADYRAARIGAAAALTITLVALLLIDAANPAYEVSATVLGVLSTMILVLLGIEAASFVKGDK
jgi:hypothetical protein